MAIHGKYRKASVDNEQGSNQLSPKYEDIKNCPKKSTSSFFGLLLVVLMVSLFYGCSGDSAIKTIKSFNWAECPDKTIDQMIKGNFKNPKWSVLKPEGNVVMMNGRPHDIGKKTLVNIKGKMFYMGEYVDAQIRLLLAEEKNYFDILSFTVDNKPLDDFTIFAVFDSLCVSYK